MENQSAQSTNQIVVSKRSSSIPIKSIFIFVIILTVGFILGFVTRTFTNPQNTNPPLSKQPAIDESKLPISLALLTNPIVYQWRGSIKGKLTRKEDHFFTLVDDKNNSLTITDTVPTGEKWNTLFFDKNNQRREASYSAIPEGSTLSGEFFIFKNGPNTPVGNVFIKE